MSELPTGTVSLLFSDVEGSTVLLSRLGAAYAEALDGQRQVLRKAWAEHGGTELGTEGDSFFVVFPTAEGAVAAAVQAQRDLSAFDWPEGEPVRVRMGIHTGCPMVHDGGYVGMDVHRAARIAGAAHGGQVLVSSATAQLAERSLPSGVALRDLGSHQLKDIRSTERLLQLVIPGLRTEFPQLKTLGAASSLPMPATPLLGREGELAELSGWLASPDLRLVTLTGPGGSGKTRLAIELARRSVELFPDGVYFVALASVTEAEVMWASLAEVLGVPPENRTPLGVAASIRHLRPLLVLDNLEQIVGADGAVAELMQAAPRVVAIVASRRPLRLIGEHEHLVPPLELPSDATLESVSASGAVQLFVQQAQLVRSNFTLSATNATAVVSVCRRLDGLPLALELAAARLKVLSPQALLARLDTALDMAARSDRAPSRQKTLRDTIRWSYDLLTPTQQMSFRRLGVFSGGADFDAISAVSSDADVFDAVAELVDASLATVAETSAGEPRIGMLETVRSYALDQLRDSGELDVIKERHAQHFLDLAQELSPLLRTSARFAVRTRLESEYPNLREALSWALPDTAGTTSPERLGIGLSLYTALRPFYDANGNFAEDQRWVERAIALSKGTESPKLGQCLLYRAANLRYMGDLDGAREHATASVEMLRALGDPRLSGAICTLASIEWQSGNPATARPLYGEALRIAREVGDHSRLLGILGVIASFERFDGNYERSLELLTEALNLALELDDSAHAWEIQSDIACTLREMGHAQEAREQMREVIPQAIALNEPGLMIVAEDYAAILAEVGDYATAAMLLGAADESRDQLRLPRDPLQEAQIFAPIAGARAALTGQEWEAAYQTGRRTTVENALRKSSATETRTTVIT